MSVLLIYLSQLSLCGEVGKPAEPLADQRIGLLQAAPVTTRYICNAAEINHDSLGLFVQKKKQKNITDSFTVSSINVPL